MEGGKAFRGVQVTYSHGMRAFVPCKMMYALKSMNSYFFFLAAGTI